MSRVQERVVTAFEPLTPERRRAMTRQHLLEAAAIVFARDGFQASSLDAIASYAGFTKGAVYSNFNSKEDLFLAVFEERIERGRATIRSALEGDDAWNSAEVWKPRVASAVKEMWWDDDWTMLFLEFVLYAARNPSARSKLAAYVRRQLGAVEQIFSDQYDAAAAPPPRPLEDLALMSVAMFDGLAVYRLIDESFTNDQRLTAALEFLSDATDVDMQTGREPRATPSDPRATGGPGND
jgi:AcrR family transcriptional regulator